MPLAVSNALPTLGLICFSLMILSGSLRYLRRRTMPLSLFMGIFWGPPGRVTEEKAFSVITLLFVATVVEEGAELNLQSDFYFDLC